MNDEATIFTENGPPWEEAPDWAECYTEDWSGPMWWEVEPPYSVEKGLYMDNNTGNSAPVRTPTIAQMALAMWSEPRLWKRPRPEQEQTP